MSSRGDKNNILLQCVSPGNIYTISLRLVVSGMMRSGFGKAIQGCLRLKEGGLCHIGLPCSSFIWLNRATSQRSLDSAWGDESKSYVSDSNTKLGSLYCFFLWNVYHVYCSQYPMHGSKNPSKDSNQSAFPDSLVHLERGLHMCWAAYDIDFQIFAHLLYGETDHHQVHHSVPSIILALG